MKISIEKLDIALIEECEVILAANQKESGHFIEDLDIYWTGYLALGDCFVSITLRDKDDNLHGILFFLVSLYSNISYLLMAQQVTFYIKKNYRFYAYKMIKFSEQVLEDKHVDFIIQSSRYDSKFCNVLDKMGYDRSDIQFIKRLA